MASGNRRIGLEKTEGKRTLALGKGLYMSGHIRALQYHGISENLSYCFVRGKVIPQQKTGDTAYNTWVVLQKEAGQVCTAECSCIVGIQATCKHIAGLLFAVVEAVEEGRNVSSTSQKQAWGKASKVFRIALVQMAVSANKVENITKAVKLVKEAAASGAKLVALPECFNCPYGTSYFADYSEKVPGASTDALAKAAAENNVFLIGGSIPEEDQGNIYNTCTVFNPEGNIIAKYRKAHLFDIDVPGRIKFKESDVLSPGNGFAVVDTPYCKIGIGICYDMRFAEMAQIYNQKGCKLLVYPGAFNMTTGPAHWELLQRGRAIDNQLYVATVSPARDEAASYIAWGHSSAINPWGEVIAKADSSEKIVYADIDPSYVDEVRTQIPVGSQKRSDMYEVKG